MKILIADDEDYSREGLIESIEWEEFGIDEIMQALNGQEALRIAKWFEPDIVLTDIRMPRMDGINFAKELLENQRDCKIIFISGYMEIEYLKNAIRLSAVDYIEKPIDLNILKEALVKAVREIRERQESREARKKSKDIRQQTLVSLLCSKEPDAMTIERLAREEDFPLHTSYVCVVLRKPASESQEQKEDMSKMIQILQSRNGRALCRYDHDKRQFQLIVSFLPGQQYHLMPVYQRLLEAFPEAKLGVGIEVEDYKCIYNSSRTAMAALNCAFYQEEKRFFQIDEEIQYRRFIEPGIYGEFQQILSQQPHKLGEWFRTLCRELRKNKYYQKEQVSILMVSLLTVIYDRYPELYGEHPAIDREEQIQPYVYGMESLRKIEDFISGILSCLQEQNEKKAGYSRIVTKVIDYVAQHYGEEDLSVVQIAAYLHFSPAYLNVLFKQEMKVTVKQYLSNYRLERSKKLLEKNFDKVTEIAQKCGYANANYFAKVFREATGMTPAEYRKSRE